MANPTKDHKLACIHRAGCPKPEVCGKVGHCTSMTEADLKLHADMSREEVDAVMDRTTAARTSNPRRFVLTRDPISPLGVAMEHAKTGPWVPWEDCEVLIRERDEARDEAERMRRTRDEEIRRLRSAHETSDKPVAWRYLADSAYEQRPRWVYFEENTPTVRLVAEGRTLEPLYSRGSPEEPTRPLPDHLKAPVKAGDPCPAVEDVHTEHKGKCMYCGAPMAPVKARELHVPDCQARLTHELGFKTLSPCTCGAENGDALP